MNGRVLRADDEFFLVPSADDGTLIDALRRERRHAAVVFLSTGIALGIGFALCVDIAVACVARL